MNRLSPALYIGKVTHRRLQPVQHELKYNVAAVLIDVDQLDHHAKRLALFSHNRFNLFAILDRHHGAGDGAPLAAHLWDLVSQAPGATGVVRQIHMLCYPAILGFAFNPLTTYYCLDEEGHIRLMIYEVRNTFGGRHAYVTKLFAVGEACHTTADKVMQVSPFNRVEGHYGLTTSLPGETLGLGVTLTTAAGPIMKAYFAATRNELSDRNLLKIFFSLPFMTFKVVAGIHWEALKLWLKGLRPKPQQAP